MLNIKFGEVFPRGIKNIFQFNPYKSKEKKITVKQTEVFHRNKNKIFGVIMQKTDKHEIIHGERAVEKQLPDWLHRFTEDVDIFSDTPRKDAREVERALDKKFGSDSFFIKQGEHPGTVRVVAHANQKSYVDYTKPEREIPFVVIDGKNYATLSYIKKHTRGILDDPTSSFRHAKDRDTLNRIKIDERRKRRLF